MCLAEPLLPDAEPTGDDPSWPEPLTGRDGPWTTVDAGPARTAGGIPAPRPGERVVVAGAGFLGDGDRVRLAGAAPGGVAVSGGAR